MRGRRGGRRRAPGRAPAPVGVGRRGRLLRAPSGGRRALHRDRRIQSARRLRGDRDLRADAARQPPRARPRLPGGRRDPAVAASCTRAGWWCSSRRPIRAPRASACCRSSRSRAWRRGASSTSPTRPSASTPAAPITRSAPPRRSSAASPRSAAARAAELYRLICDEVVEVSSPEVAELTKLLENIFRSVNIALVNELAQLCDRMGIDVWEVVDAAATKPFGFMRFEPGPGMGGHCLPVDPFYLAFKAREHDFYTEFIELAGKLNQSQPQFCVEKIERTLNEESKPVTRLADPGAGRRLQGRRRRPARVAGAEDHQRACASWAPRSPTTTRTSRSCRSSACLGGPRTRSSDGPTSSLIVTAHPRGGLRAGRARGGRSCSTSAG